MYVRMRDYPEFIGHRKLADLVFFWIKDDLDSDEDTIKDKFADWLRGTDESPSWLYKFCDWIYNKRSDRRVKVRIDKFDTYSMYDSLAVIILPMLKDLKKIKRGAPHVDDEDVPEHLRSTAATSKENDWDTDEYFFDRWDYVLEEMIWSFEQIIDDNWEQFYHILPDGSKGDFMAGDTEEYNARIQNGTRLFGKYYRNLWW